jgi:flagellar hook-length control protein FliK
MKGDAGIPLTVDGMKEILIQAEAAAKNLSAQENKTGKAEVEGQTSADNQKQPVEAENEVITEASTGNTGKVKEENVTEDKTATENNSGTGSLNADTQKAESLNAGNSGTQENTGKEHDKDLKAQDQFQMFIDNMVKATREIVPDFNAGMIRATELHDIAQQIIERIRISVMPDQSSMELQLNPESLGKVNLTVQSKDGVMTAQFVVQNEISKEAIESQLSTLRETLNQQGIKVEAIEVTVSANAFEQSNEQNSQSETDTQKNNSGKHITMEEAINMTEMSEEESTMQDITGNLGSQIDYTA